jgi:hypothetical protein
MSYNGVGPDLTFLNKKMKLGRHSGNWGRVCFDEQISHAQIPHCGYTLMSSRAPIHIDTPACLDSGVNPSRREVCRCKMCSTGLAWSKSVTPAWFSGRAEEMPRPLRFLEGKHFPTLPHKA